MYAVIKSIGEAHEGAPKTHRLTVTVHVEVPSTWSRQDVLDEIDDVFTNVVEDTRLVYVSGHGDVL